MARGLQALNVAGKLVCILAYSLGHGLYALGDKITKSLSFCHKMSTSHNGLAISKGKVDTAGIFCGQKTPLKTFHEKCYRTTIGYSVYPVIVTKSVCFNNLIKVIYTTV